MQVTRIRILLLSLFVAAAVMIGITVEAVRTRRIATSERLSELIPQEAYGDSILPDVLLDNTLWIIAAGVVWIVVAALLVGREALRDGVNRPIVGEGDNNAL